MTLQRYVSRELTHFVGRSLRLPDGQANEEAQYSLFLQILRSGWLTHPPHKPNVHGNLSVTTGAKISENQMYSPEIVCFCDIPTADLYIHISKYSRFGLSFAKSFLAEKGANPVFYIARDSKVLSSPDMSELLEMTQRGDTRRFFEDIQAKDAFALKSITRAEYYDRMLQVYHTVLHKLLLNPSDREGFDLRHFFDFQVFSFMKFFDHSLPQEDRANFYMEREWRLIGNLNFSLDDVYRVIIPQVFAKRFRADLPAYTGQVTYAGDSGGTS